MIPKVLAQNAGYDPQEVMVKLLEESATASGPVIVVDVYQCTVSNVIVSLGILNLSSYYLTLVGRRIESVLGVFEYRFGYFTKK